MKKTTKIDSWNGFNKKINELRSETYSDIMDRTQDYEWRMSGDVASEETEKLSRVNQLARERFEEEFYSEFPIGTEITNGDKVYTFAGLKFKTAFTNYELVFKPVEDEFDPIEGEVYVEPLIIQYDPENGYYLGYNVEDNLDRESISTILDMFWYKIRSRNRKLGEKEND